MKRGLTPHQSAIRRGDGSQWLTLKDIMPLLWPEGRMDLKGRVVLSMESTSNRMSRLGKSLITGSELLSLEELVERVDAVTGDEVAEIAGDLLRLDRLSAAGIGPSEARFKAAVQRVNPALVGRRAA